MACTRQKRWLARRFLNTAVEAIRTGRGQGPKDCYYDAAKSSGLDEELMMMLSNDNMDDESIRNDDNDLLFLRARV